MPYNLALLCILSVIGSLGEPGKNWLGLYPWHVRVCVRVIVKIVSVHVLVINFRVYRSTDVPYVQGYRLKFLAGVNCDEEQEQDYYINWPRERGKLQDSYSPSAEDADSLSPRTAWMKGDNSSCASHLRNDYIDSHPVTDSRQRRTSGSMTFETEYCSHVHYISAIYLQIFLKHNVWVQ